MSSTPQPSAPKHSTITTMEDIASLGTILSVWAHPDDETFCCGGLLSWAARNGQRVVCVTATRGEAGSQDLTKWPLATLGKTRTQEMKAALKVYGIEEHYWLDYADGCCCDVADAEPEHRLAVIIKRVSPDTVITFGKEGMTGHPDHQAVCRWTHAALKKAGTNAQVLHPVIAEEQYLSHYAEADDKLNMFYAIEMPPTKPERDCDVCLHLPKDVMARKHAAIQAMPSQMEIMLQTLDPEHIDGMIGTECLVRCKSEG